MPICPPWLTLSKETTGPLETETKGTYKHTKICKAATRAIFFFLTHKFPTYSTRSGTESNDVTEEDTVFFVQSRLDSSRSSPCRGRTNPRESDGRRRPLISFLFCEAVSVIVVSSRATRQSLPQRSCKRKFGKPHIC